MVLECRTISPNADELEIQSLVGEAILKGTDLRRCIFQIELISLIHKASNKPEKGMFSTKIHLFYAHK